MVTRKHRVKVGDLVRMNLGWSGVGVVQEVMNEHPRANEAQFSLVRKNLQRKHVRVFWTDEQESETLPLDNVKVVE
jgi:hypothetical protein